MASLSTAGTATLRVLPDASRDMADARWKPWERASGPCRIYVQRGLTAPGLYALGAPMLLSAPTGTSDTTLSLRLARIL